MRWESRQLKVAENHDGDLRQVVLDSAARTRMSINGPGMI